MVQWLTLLAPKAGGLGLIPGQGTRSHMMQLRAHTTKTLPSQIYLKKKNADRKIWKTLFRPVYFQQKHIVQPVQEIMMKLLLEKICSLR